MLTMELRQPGPVGSHPLVACDRPAPEPGPGEVVNAIHLDGIPRFDYGDPWWERTLRSVANVTRAGVNAARTIVPGAQRPGRAVFGGAPWTHCRRGR